MATRAAKSVAAEEIAAIEQLMSDLEARLQRLSGKGQRETAGATKHVNDVVSEALAGIMHRVRENATDASGSLADEATRLGAEAFKKLSDELENRPMVMLGVAAGIGFLAGLINRR